MKIRKALADISFDVIEIFWNAELLVQVSDIDGRKLSADPRVDGENVVGPAVGPVGRHLDLLLKLLQQLRIAVAVLLDLGAQLVSLVPNFGKLGQDSISVLAVLSTTGRSGDRLFDGLDLLLDLVHLRGQLRELLLASRRRFAGKRPVRDNRAVVNPNIYF